MKWSFTLLIIIQCLTCLTAQNTEAPEGEATLGQISHHSFCGPIPDKPLEQRKKDAKRFIAWYQPRKARPKAPPKTIPVVFHLLEDVPTITNEAVVNAVASLNNAYTHSQKYPNGADFSIGTRGVDTQIEFCLAQRAPDGGITNGIVRWETDYARMDVDLEDAKLKTQGQWDPRRYLNIWIVSEGLDVETDQDYSGRTSWTREANLGGYSGGPGGVVGPDARQDGVIAVGLGAALLAHENGHYLSLPHTFSATCANNDCLVDGDGICDTPPDISQAGCNQNTCSSDTLSNYSNGFFPTDVPDMTSNFMDYSSCPNEFTQGQADKMHFVLDNFRIDLPVEAPSSNPACNRPCDADFSVSFDINERYRETNVPYNFTSSVLGTVTVDSFAWHVERLGHPGLDYTIAWLEGFVPSAPAVATTPNLQHTFSEPGKYRVYLRAWNSADPDCYASYSRVVRVTCLGIDARFTPNVRFIAAKQPSGKMVDSVLFINRSINATSYEWTVRHEPYDNMAPAQPLFTSDSVDLNHTFLEPGDYFITLIAKNGPACQDTMGPFRLPVDDPTIDGVIRINQVDCYREDSIRVAFEISNNGYDTIRVGMPVTFYDEDPRNANPVPTVLGTYYLDRVVYGRDRAENFVAIVPASKPKLDQIWAAFNVLGNESIPITWPTPDLNVMSVNSEFPPTGANELNYRNNFASRRDFQFRVDLSMVEDVACKFTDVQLQADHRNGRDLNGVEWVPDDRLSCTDCLTPTLSLLDVDHVQDVILTSEYFCKDTASLSISVIKDDIPLPTVNNPTDFCRQDNQVEVANFVSGQQLSWYDVPTGSSGRPTPPAMPLNTPGTFNHWISQTINGCEGPRANFTFTVLELPDPPTVGNIPNVCEGEAPPDLATFVVGNNITWYSQETGGTGSSQPVGVATDQAGTFQYWVSTVGSECESERVQVAYTVISETVPPPVPAPMTICFGDTPPDLNSLTPGTDLRWYQSDTGGTGATSAPLVDTRQPGTFSHWVSQTSGNCESPRAELSYTILPEIPVPSIINPTDQCLGDTPIDLTTLVSGQQLRWYASQDTLDGTDTPPLASTDSAGTFTLWVSQVQSNCESERRPLSYTINPIPANPTASDLQNICAGNTLPNFNGS
ncbi:MAG: M43 family zinc metalloprotease, partial [Bacteroidota bacterium]